VAAGDHEARHPLGHAEGGDGRAGDATHIARPVAQISHRLGAGSQDTARAGAIIPRQGHLATRLDRAAGGDILEEAERIGVTDAVGHLHRQSPRPAGAELDPALDHQIPDLHPLSPG
jgi:hypothetical protein